MEQRLLAESIPGQQQPPRLLIGERKCKHAVETLDAGVAVLFVRVDDGFGVGVCSEPVTSSFEITAQLVVVVDLAVENDPHRPIFVGQWLIAARAIDDGEAPVSEGVPGRATDGAAVRTAMRSEEHTSELQSRLHL